MAIDFASHVGQVTLSTLAPDIVTSLGITTGLFSVAFTGLSTMSSLAQLPSGILSDRYSERILLLAAIVLTCISTLLLTLSPTYLIFFLMMLAVGIGSGLYYTPSTTLLDELYDQIGQAIGTYRISGQVAGVVGPVLVGFLGLYVGWRSTLFAVGLILVPVFAGVLVFMRPIAPIHPEAPLQAHASPRQLISLLSRPGLAVTTVLASLIQFVEVAAFTFLPTILQQYHGLSSALAGTLSTVYFAQLPSCNPSLVTSSCGGFCTEQNSPTLLSAIFSNRTWIATPAITLLLALMSSPSTSHRLLDLRHGDHLLAVQ